MTTYTHEGVHVEIRQITPELATAILGGNTHNRHLRELRVDRIARDIEAGLFDLNGETIKLAEDGTVLDGQHRLVAVVRADKPIWTVLVTGLPIGAQDTVDRVHPRNLADALRIAGEPNSNLLAGAINNSWVLMSDAPSDLSKYWPTMHQGLKYLEDHPEIRQAVAPADNIGRTLRTPSVSAAAMYHIFARIDEEDANDFFEKLASGANLEADSPIYRLRDFMMRELSANRRVSRTRLHAYWIKCWNAYRRGDPMQQLRWSSGGAHPEQFPRPE